MKKKILGVGVDLLSRSETIEKISKMVKKRDCKLVVTAYSEFLVRAQEDKEFKEVLDNADLVTPDGVSVWAAASYLKKVKSGDGVFAKFGKGMGVGLDIVSGKMPESVTGVWLFEELTKMAPEKDWKIFLLGGWNNVAERAVRILQERYPKIKVTYDEGEEKVGSDLETDRRVIRKIRAFSPDILFVSYNPVKQEKWIWSHKEDLNAGVAIGVGGTFGEYVGDFPKAPEWMEKAGLKWLWRLRIEPKRIGRIWRAVIVFPWMVFRRGI